MHYLEKVKGKNYQNFQNYAQAVAMLEHYKRAHNLETISDASRYADSKEFYEMAGFSKEQAKKWMEEATKDSKDTVKALQEFFAANREFMVETGLASRAQAEALNSFEYYLPSLAQIRVAAICGDLDFFANLDWDSADNGGLFAAAADAKRMLVRATDPDKAAGVCAEYKRALVLRGAASDSPTLAEIKTAEMFLNEAILNKQIRSK